MLDKIDEDGSGVIEFDEFVKMMTAKMGERESKEEIKRAFRLFDIDETVSANQFYMLFSVATS
jgi:centrin-1